MNDEEQTVFVNRHGRRTALGKTDLDKLDIEHDAPLEQKTPPPKQPSVPRKISLPKGPRPQMSRRMVILSSVVLCALIVLPLLAFEALAWQYRNSSQSLKSDVTRIGKEVALPEQKKASLSADAIQKTLAELSKARDKACKGGMLDNLAELYPRSKEAREQCAVMNGSISQLITGLSTLKNLQAYNANIDSALKPALAASDSPYAVIPDQVSAWQETAKKLAAISPPQDAAAFHGSLIQVVSDIEKQWSAINTANNAQDLESFKEAETKLASFYESLRDLAPNLATVQSAAQSKVSQAATSTSSN